MRETTAARLRNDRVQLLAALRDYRLGRFEHMPSAEQRHSIESIERRIADLSEKLSEKAL